MRTLIHLSDLHFGRVDPAIPDRLLAFIQGVRPDLVAISGDFTQRARTAEYVEADEFLRQIPFPAILVPGNHDVPLRNLFLRFFRGLDGYRRYLTDDLQPFFCDEEIAVAGVNTARAWTWKDGRINRAQLKKLRESFAGLAGEQMRIVVTHHPFALPAGAHGAVGGAFASGDEDAGSVPHRYAARGAFPLGGYRAYGGAVPAAGLLGAGSFVGYNHFHARPGAAELVQRHAHRAGRDLH